MLCGGVGVDTDDVGGDRGVDGGCGCVGVEPVTVSMATLALISNVFGGVGLVGADAVGDASGAGDSIGGVVCSVTFGITVLASALGVGGGDGDGVVDGAG